MIKRLIYIALLIATSAQAQTPIQMMRRNVASVAALPPASLVYAPPWQHPNWFSMDAFNHVDLVNPVSDDVLNKGLVSWWLPLPSTQGGSVLYDLMGRNHGTLTNMTPATDWVAGRRGTALDFDGVDDYVDVGAPSSLQPTTALSIVAWAKITELTVDDFARIVDFTDAASAGAGGYRLFLSASSGTWRYRLFTDGSGTNVNSSETPTTDERTFLVATYDGADMKLYVNAGTPASTSKTGSITYSGVTNFNIGSVDNTTDSQELFNGQIDDVRIYNRALSAAEVRALYEDSQRGYPRTLNFRR